MADTCCRCSFSDFFNVFGEPFANRFVCVSFEFSLWVWTTLFCVICNVCFFHLNRTYVGVIRYSSFIDISRIFISLTLGYFVVCIGNLLWIGWSGGEVLPISVILTAYIVNFSLMVCLRILVK